MFLEILLHNSHWKSRDNWRWKMLNQSELPAGSALLLLQWVVPSTEHRGPVVKCEENARHDLLLLAALPGRGVRLYGDKWRGREYYLVSSHAEIIIRSKYSHFYSVFSSPSIRYYRNQLLDAYFLNGGVEHLWNLDTCNGYKQTWHLHV